MGVQADVHAVQRFFAARLGEQLLGQVGRQLAGGEGRGRYRGDAALVQAKLLVGVGVVAQVHGLARAHKACGAAGGE